MNLYKFKILCTWTHNLKSVIPFSWERDIMATLLERVQEGFVLIKSRDLVLWLLETLIGL
jgi:hypothetical protein